ncbi:MAG: DUF3052 family protein [Acidobacteriota bacterium]
MSSSSPRPTAGYSKTPLVKKLGLKPGMQAAFIDAPDHYDDLLGPLPDEVEVRTDLRARRDFIHVFARRESDLAKRLAAVRRSLRPDGLVWLSWPKKTSSLATDLDGGAIRRLGQEAGLVDTKVCAVDQDWSGHKFVVRLADR